MSAAPVAIVGSGIVATAFARQLCARGVAVQIYEKGPEIPYPHAPQYERRILYHGPDPSPRVAADLDDVESTRKNLSGERSIVVGGTATRWGAMAGRLHPNDFRTRSLHGYGIDWPFGYEELEPWYCAAEAMLGVSGSDEGNPFAAPRSMPYPLPPFELGYDGLLLADRLKQAGIVLHTSAQARTRAPYDGRPACVNFGVCGTCPIGARYSPNHHIRQLLAQGRCKLRPETSVRRVVVEGGRARAIVVRRNAGGNDEEIPARAVVVAAGAIETSRLLLLSKGPGHPEGVGNARGGVGRYFAFHHIWRGHLDFSERMMAGQTGPELGQSRQFIDPQTRGRHGGVLVQIPSIVHADFHPVQEAMNGRELVEARRARTRCEGIYMHAEARPSEARSITLSSSRDRFGDPFARVDYPMEPDFDAETHAFAQKLFERIRSATRAEGGRLAELAQFVSGHHHMGGCRMANDPADGVVDGFGRVHGVANLWIAGGSTFPTVGAVHPTLTMVALALRAADRLATDFGS
jgi:choline dehydrogenase-like flavoprotein